MKKLTYEKWFDEYKFALIFEHKALETDLTFEEYCKEEYNKIR